KRAAQSRRRGASKRAAAPTRSSRSAGVSHWSRTAWSFIHASSWRGGGAVNPGRRVPPAPDRPVVRPAHEERKEPSLLPDPLRPTHETGTRSRFLAPGAPDAGEG